MKTINMLILINPSQNCQESEKLAGMRSADRFILIDSDLDFADRLALILERRRQEVTIIPYLERLEGLFSHVADFPYSIAVEYYGARRD